MQNASIGIDIAKNSFDLVVYETGEHNSYTMSDKDIAKALNLIKSTKPKIVVMEATGGYETKITAKLIVAEIPMAVVNPRKIRDFARATGRTAKTDKIDAEAIAHYAAVLKPPQTKSSSLAMLELKELVRRRRQLVELRKIEKNHAEASAVNYVQKSISSVVKTLDLQIAKIDQLIADYINSMTELQIRKKILTSIPGISDTTAQMLVCDLPELGHINRRQLSSLVGVAPMNRDSGILRGKRMICGGRKAVRTALYMPALAAIRCNTTIREFYMRLVNAGKPKKVAIIAVIRKLLTIINSMVKHGTFWSQNLA